MKRKGTIKAVVLCTLLSFTLVACNTTKEPTLSNNHDGTVTLNTEQSNKDEALQPSKGDNMKTNPNIENKVTETNPQSEGYNNKVTFKGDDVVVGTQVTQIQPTSATNNRQVHLLNLEKKDVPLEVKERSYIDDYGVLTIEKTYKLSYDANINNVAPERITVNNVEYIVDNIAKPQGVGQKKHTITKIAKTQKEAGTFNKTFEYNTAEGKGVLQIDPKSIKVVTNSTTVDTHSVGATKYYTMNIKDESKIPNTITDSGVTMYLGSVHWSDNGDNGQSADAGDTYNTVASSFTATATYSGSYNTSNSDYKGSATYVGNIILNNPASDTYKVTYKPDQSIPYNEKVKADRALDGIATIQGNSNLIYVLVVVLLILLILLICYLFISKFLEAKKPKNMYTNEDILKFMQMMAQYNNSNNTSVHGSLGTGTYDDYEEV